MSRTSSGGSALAVTVALGASLVAAAPVEATAPEPALATASTASSTSVTKVATSRATEQKERAANAVSYASKQIGDRYRFGGSGPDSWDCSGLAGGAWRKAGVRLPRTSQQIYRAVKKKVTWREAAQGDLLFFYGGRPHVGIYAGRGFMIHAPGSGRRVMKTKLNGYYKRHFNGAVRPGS